MLHPGEGRSNSITSVNPTVRISRPIQIAIANAHNTSDADLRCASFRTTSPFATYGAVATIAMTRIKSE